MSAMYILVGKTAEACDDPIKWGQWYQSVDRHVANDQIESVQVSTVFLGLDHGLERGGPPSLFETMVFGGMLDQEQERYATWEEAEEGHKEMVERVKQSLKQETL